MTAPRDPRRGEHETFDELAVGWALHALEPEDEELFAAHLPTCPRCRQTVSETADVMGALAGDLPPVDPPDRLRERLRAAVEEAAPLPRPAWQGERTPLVPPAVPDRPAPVHRSEPPATGAHRAPFPVDAVDPRSSWRRVLPNALVAAAVAAILALGTWNVVLSSAREEARAAAAEQAELVDALLTPGQATVAPLTADGATVATVVAREGQVQVVTQGLRPNDQDQTYVVWGTGAGGPAPLGTFDVTSPQPALCTVGSGPSGLDAYTGYAVSLEPGRSAPPEPSDIVASGEVPS
ncbi:Anti-sigma-K factor rskA [Geodermatophilus siccatus]|uniref:Regulator of SigK n=1 Tax=Geodermatophilus siccatus TaxID=1137991 RepID=A0A1G9SQX1_9ACTN|nr:anti-sigma factor [Geodermatophilus siccatus]SDM37780.1 Anti-sigma-K factor rskA [Geodermatophilus siccatus]